MKHYTLCLFIMGALFFVSSVSAKDELNNNSIATALESLEAEKGSLGSIKIYFGNQSHPAPIKHFGEIKSLIRARISGNQRSTSKQSREKYIEGVCLQAFKDSFLDLQNKALNFGVEAVVNVRRNWKDIETSGETGYVCAKGNSMVGVALKGTIITTTAQ